MPTGTQQAFTGLICCRCNRGIDDEHTLYENLCSSCTDNIVVECSNCGDVSVDADLITRDEMTRLRIAGIYYRLMVNAQDSGEYICIDCVYTCGDCNEYYQWEDSMLECCVPESSSIYYYSYKPIYSYSSVVNGSVSIRSRPEVSQLYMGIEIEIEKMRGIADGFHDMLSQDQAEFVYMKEDGSLGSEGVELVTMPATLEAFEKRFPFEHLGWARASGARSFAYQSCGFHIHVSRSAFSPTHLWKFVQFQLKNPDLCQFVGQRGDVMYSTWSFDQSERNSIPDYVKGKKSNGRRYLAINFQNTHTVELRYFKGNILQSAIMKNLEFVDSMYEYTKNLSIRDVMNGALSRYKYQDWLLTTEKYDNLKSFIEVGYSKESF